MNIRTLLKTRNKDLLQFKMVIYYCIFAFAIFLGLFLKAKKVVHLSPENVSHTIHVVDAKSNTAYIVLFSILVTLAAGFRNINVGADTSSYIAQYFLPIFNNSLLETSSNEFSFNIIARFASLFGNNYTVFLVIVSFLTSCLFMKFIFDNSNNVFLSIVVFLGMFYVQSLNLMREWLAIGFGLNAYSFFNKKKYIFALLFFFLAFFTHSSSLCLVIIPFFKLFKNKNVLLIVAIVFSVLLIVFKTFFLSIVSNVLPKYLDYISDGYFENSSAFNPKDLIFFLILSIYLFFLFFRRNLFSLAELNSFYDYSVFLILAIAFSFLGQQFFMFHRLVFYYSSFLIVSLPNLSVRLKNRSIFSIVIILAMLFMLFRNSISDNNGISHYSFFWN